MITDKAATQNVTAEFIEHCNNHKRLKQIVTWVMPDVETNDGVDDEEGDPPQGETGVVIIIQATTNTTNFPYGKTRLGKTTKR